MMGNLTTPRRARGVPSRASSSRPRIYTRFGPSLLTPLSCLGGTNKPVDLQNPDNLGQQDRDNGYIPNLKWAFSDSKTNIFSGGWVREQITSDLPASHDISGAQQHLKKGAIRELHWHRVVS